VVWGAGFEPAPSEPLKLSVSPALDGWVAVAFLWAMTFDIPLTAWLASHLGTRTLAAYTWGDGYGLVAFDKSGVTWGEGHIRDERSDMHLSHRLRNLGVPFDGDEDCPAPYGDDSPRRLAWLEIAVPPRPWPLLPAIRC